MPTIPLFYGISIRMYYRHHAPPHFHAIYGGAEAVFDISSSQLLAGNLPVNATRLVQQWAELHKKDLLKNWQLADEGETLERIPGLDAE